MPTAVELKPIGTVRLTTSHGVFLASSVVFSVETPYDPSTGHVTGKRQWGPGISRNPVIVIVKAVDVVSGELGNHHKHKRALRSVVIALNGRLELKLTDVQVVKITKRADGLEEIHLSA